MEKEEAVFWGPNPKYKPAQENQLPAKLQAHGGILHKLIENRQKNKEKSPPKEYIRVESKKEPIPRPKFEEVPFLSKFNLQ